ncbi:MAG: hypothetical protein KatS3mg114_1104 [Planctomycetaceae bacterium]|nr:MAG: hypothetical protein KatS3mg114_1104 [Planctomycetaceae bacterium]
MYRSPQPRDHSNHGAHSPPTFWWFLLAVGVFGLSDYARSFLIWLALQALGAHTSSANTPSAQTMLSLSMLLYAGHNLLSGMVAYPLGWWGDRWSRRHLLVIGYALGMVSNALLWLCGVGVISIILVMVLSALMLAAEETLEKAVAAQLLPVDLRSLGLGLLAAVNALGDMMSSLMLGWWLQQGQHAWAFAVATVLAACGTCLLGFLPRHFERSSSVVPHH